MKSSATLACTKEVSWPIIEVSHSSSNRFTFDSALPLSAVVDAAAFFDGAAVAADSFLFAVEASFFCVEEEAAGDFSVLAVDFASGVDVGVTSTVAEAFSSGEGAGLSSCANRHGMQLKAMMQRSDVNDFISISFRYVLGLKRRLREDLTAAPAATERTCAAIRVMKRESYLAAESAVKSYHIRGSFFVAGKR
jgi:hypothetical protein